ncbi:MAG: cyclic nucleotide-binding domain-containing protein, partial [Mariprofundaceae bacterium]|nr:cyclic nucleotide-binding domain-containing protein [Mariprofundaceae bacterium]
DSPQEHSDNVFSLIEELSDQEALNFIRQAKMITCKQGDTLIHDGEIGNQFYMILQGHMSVYIHLNDGEALKIKVLSDGDYFGEYACIYKLPRTATIIADEDTLLLEFPDTAISSLMVQSPDAGGILMHIMAQRLIQSMTHIHPAFSDIVDGDHAWVAEESNILDIRAESELLPRSTHAYLILHGRLSILQDGKVTTTLQRSQMFSQLNPHLCLPEDISLIAQERSLICEIPRDIFNSFMDAYGSFEGWVETQNNTA